jgi:anti-sigma factor RsiW
MNSCQEISELFSDYVEKTLVEKDRQAMDVHLRACAACRDTVGRIAKLRHNLKSLMALEASPDFEMVLRTRMRLERHRMRPWASAMPLSPVRAMAFAAFLIVLISGAVFSYLRFLSPGSPAFVQTSSSQANLSAPSPAKAAGATLAKSYQRYVYALEGVTIPDAPGAALRISSVGLAKYQALQVDTSAASLPAELDPVLVSF